MEVSEIYLFVHALGSAVYFFLFLFLFYPAVYHRMNIPPDSLSNLLLFLFDQKFRSVENMGI